MLASLRSRAVLALALVSLAACGDETKLPTTLDAPAALEDIELTQAAFETPQAMALVDLGYDIDLALTSAGGAATLAAVVAEGPVRVRAPRASILEQVEQATSTPMAALPPSAVGKVFEWDFVDGRYEPTARTGAPANGVRFILYTVDSLTLEPADPLVEVGYADLTREGTDANPAARLVVKTTGGVTVFQYVATIGGTPSVPSFSVTGSAGTGPNAATFSLTVGVNVVQGTITATWRTAIPARGLTTRTTLGLGENTFSISGVMQRGLNKVSIAGTLNYLSGGQLTVKVGDATFARIVTDMEGGTTITNPEGQPLTPEEEAVLEMIFDWFQSSMSWTSGLLDPVYVVLGVE